MVRAQVQEQHVSVRRILSSERARNAVGTLTAKMSNLFSSDEFALIANPLQEKDISQSLFGI